MNSKLTVLMIGKDTALNYLFNRFAEQGGYVLVEPTEDLSAEQIETANLTAVLFLTTELLANHQVLVTELVTRDLPILVCSSRAEEGHARELGADFCLIHPLTYDDFKSTLDTINTTKSP